MSECAFQCNAGLQSRVAHFVGQATVVLGQPDCADLSNYGSCLCPYAGKPPDLSCVQALCTPDQFSQLVNSQPGLCRVDSAPDSTIMTNPQGYSYSSTTMGGGSYTLTTSASQSPPLDSTKVSGSTSSNSPNIRPPIHSSSSPSSSERTSFSHSDTTSLATGSLARSTASASSTAPSTADTTSDAATSGESIATFSSGPSSGNQATSDTGNASRHTSRTLTVVLPSALAVTAAVAAAFVLWRWKRRHLTRGLRVASNTPPLPAIHPSALTINSLPARLVGGESDDARRSTRWQESSGASRVDSALRECSVRAHYGAPQGSVDVPDEASEKAGRARPSLPAPPPDVYRPQGTPQTHHGQSHAVAPQGLPYPQPMDDASERAPAFPPAAAAALAPGSRVSVYIPQQLAAPSDANAGEHVVVLPWPLGERLVAWLADARVPGDRESSAGDSSDTLPGYEPRG